MSILDSLQNTIVSTVMSQNSGLNAITSTTFSMAGTSISNIRSQTNSAISASLGSTNYASQLYSPITQMSNYALTNATSTSQQAAITAATNNAYAAVDSSFNSAFPTGVADSLYDIQSATTGAIGTGINSFGNTLGTINPQLVSPALNLGNSALVTTGNTVTTLSNNMYNVASSTVTGAVSGVNSTVANIVSAKNSAASAASELSSAASAATSAANPFSSAGTSTASEGTVNGSVNNTDVIYQDIKLYIEGVQVPFASISISQSIGAMPTASIEIPPDAGMLDVVRYYQPKVHIFYTDATFGGDRLLFWGHLVVANYTKSRTSGMASIVFHCEHKNAQLAGVTLEFAGYASNATTIIADQNPDQATAKVNNFNSQLAIIQALQGITGMQADASDLIDPSNSTVSTAHPNLLAQRFANFENRFIGMPAAIMNFWNQLKIQCYSNVTLNTIMADMYIPLVEDGLGFFDRLAGHYFVETLVDTTKESYCPGGVTPQSTANPVMVPPAYRLNSLTAIKTSLATANITNMIGFSGELTNFMQMFTDFYSSVEYEILTLASPAQVPADPTVTINVDNPSSYSSTNMMAVETIVKPQVPFYYSPVCNVLFPKMYHTINISQDESQIPSRLTAYSDVVPGDQGLLGSQYRGPNSVREAVAYGAVMANNTNQTNLPIDLQGTTGQSFNVPGKYETGRGVRNKRITLPNWLAQLLKGKIQELGDPDIESWPDKTDPDYQAICDLHAAWIDRYGYDTTIYDDGTSEDTRNTDKDALDPYAPQSNIHPFQRLLFATADYEYTKAVVSSRMGSIDGIFNPYIIPGYPMEVLDDSPNMPCFHAMCSSVTHSFSSRGAGTSIGMVAVCTYTEMVNYFMQPIHPWLQTALQIVNTSPGASGLSSTQGSGYGNPPDDINVNSSILFNDTAKGVADQFYQSVLGIGSVAIDDLYDFQYGQLVPQARSNGLLVESSNTSRPSANGGEQNDFLTAVGNLRLVSRPIEGKNAIQDKFSITFIDLTPTNYNPTSVSYQNPNLDSDYFLEPGASIFLDYQEVADFISNSDATSNTPDVNTTATPTSGSGAPIAYG
jgi:hypothetical protein